MKEEKKEDDKRLSKEVLEKLINEFRPLDYAGKLQFMDREFGHYPSYSNELGGEPEFSVLPTNREETLLFNEWRNKFWLEWFHPDGSCPDSDYSFEWLRDRYMKTIRGIKRDNAYPDTLIAQFTNEQLKEYEEKARRYEPIFREYNGVWDLSLKVPDSPLLFLKAKAVYNYVGYLKQQQLKPSTAKMPIIPARILKKLHQEFNDILWRDISLDKFIELFDPDNTKQGQLRYKKHGYQVLIAYLFKQVCMIIGVPYTNLEPRVGPFDRTNFNDDNKPQKDEMFRAIEIFLKKMKGNKM